MQLPTEDLIRQIHDSPALVTLAITGGGSAALSSLLGAPGASATVLEGIVPYSARALRDWLGGRFDRACDATTARAMAVRAFERSRELSDETLRRLHGVACTASLASNRPKRGAHRTHVAWHSADRTLAASIELTKGRRSRNAEEQLAASLVLWLVARAAGLEVSPPSFDDDERLDVTETVAPHEWQELALARRSSVELGVLPGAPQLLFPGAFNPLHEGHLKMAAVAQDRLGATAAFELSIRNVDKPSLDFIEIAARAAQFAGKQLLLTTAPTFLDKARLVPGCTFIVGIDTLIRIGDERYYGGDSASRDRAIAEIMDLGGRFLVFGRTMGERFVPLDDAEIPKSLRELSHGVSEADFRDDISSTELRTVDDAP